MVLPGQQDWSDIARAFVDARRQAGGLDAYPGPMPRDLDQAYAIQDAALQLDGRKVGGWKLGRINPPFDAQFGANRIAGPIFADVIETASPDAMMPVIPDGFAAAEGEFLVRFGTDPDPSRPEWTLEEAKSLIDAVHIGIEIASSPFPGINAHGPGVTASDFGNNFGLLVGPELQGWRGLDLDTIPVSVAVNGREVGRETTATMLDGPFGAVRFLLELMHRRGISLHRGQWVSTGAVTGVHPVRPDDQVEARFAGLTVGCRIVAAKAIKDREREDVGSAGDGG